MDHAQARADIHEDHQKRVIDAWSDMSDLERDASNWPDAEEIEAKAAEAVLVLDELNDTIKTYLERP